MRIHDVRRQGGSSLLEVLIAVLVLAIGMLGMGALEMVTLKNSNSAAARSQAVIQTYSAFDLLRLNREEAEDGTYNVPNWTCIITANPNGPTNDSLFNTWLDGVKDSLGDQAACGRMTCAADGECTVGIRWNDSRATGGDDQLEIETSSRL